MRCPSTSDLVHAQANHAYDKLAVISDNIEALQAIYDFIFDIKEYLHQRLKEYMHKHRDELIDGQKTFTKPVRLEELELFSSVNADIEDTVGNIKLNFTTCSPYISFKVSRTDDETKEEYVSEVKLILDVCNGKPLLTIPPTNGDVPESSVRVDYLEEQLDIIRTRIASLEDRVSTAEHDIDNLEDRATQVEGRVSQVETRIDNWPPDKDTTYSFALENGRLVIRANDGTTQAVDLSSMNASIAGDVFAVGATIIIGIGYNTYLNYGVIMSGGTYAGYCPDDNGGFASGTITIPGTWVCCTSNGNSRNVRGGIIRRIA